ncbi:hypothetical protein [Spirosoma areae]
MRLLFLISAGFLLALPGRAQERVRNVRVRVVDSTQLEIRYDLINARPGDSIYFEMRSRLRGALQIRPEFVRGDVGMRTTAGADRRIIWDALANGYSLNEEVQAKVLVRTGLTPPTIPPSPSEPAVVQKPVDATPKPEPVAPKPTPAEKVVVTQPKSKPLEPAPVLKTEQPARTKKSKRNKRSVFAADTTQPAPTTPVVVSTPTPQQPTKQADPVARPAQSRSQTVLADSARPQQARYSGPAWALVSAVAPGIGNIFVQTPTPKIGVRPLLTVGCYGLLVYGFLERQKARDEYAIYEQQKNLIAGEPYYQTANDHYHRYFMATRGALVVAAADVIFTFIRGVRNNQVQKAAQRYQGFKLRPGIQAGQPTAVVRYSF